MKHYYLLLLWLCGGFVQGQNLVPNPSFEDTVACPTGGGQVWNAEYWYVAEKTPDYFNECCTHTSFAIPNNLWGSRYPATGFAYCGFCPYSTVDTFYREKIGIELLTKLEIGNRYYVSFKLSATAAYRNGANNKIGALFSTTKYTPSNPSLTNDFCQMWTDSIIIDTLNWVSVFGSFIADSAYKYLTIGNFFTNAHTDTFRFWHSNALESYYYLDDICVSKDSASCITSPTSTNALLTRQKELSMYPNPVSDYLTIQTNLDSSASLALFSLAGEIILRQNIPKGCYELREDVGQLKNGIYIVSIETHKKTITQKLIIHH